MNILIFLLFGFGAYFAASSWLTPVYRPAATALRSRAPKAMTQTEVAISRLAARLRPHMDLDPIKRMRLEESLRNLGHPESPEAFQAIALARALLLSAAAAWLVLFNVLLGLIITGTLCFSLYTQQEKKLQQELNERRQRIERELPQFARTSRQSLNSTHDVVGILQTYQKVCGPVLRAEIGHTLNDMVTGNPERALKALEGRVASPKLGQLTRGLVAVLRGDDQRLYFDMLAAEYRKSQNEEIAKALLKRPDEVNLYLVLLFTCIVLMIAASLGVSITQQMGTFFS